MHTNLNGFKRGGKRKPLILSSVLMVGCSRFIEWIDTSKFTFVNFLSTSIYTTPHILLLHNKIFIWSCEWSGGTWSVSHNITPLNTIFMLLLLLLLARKAKFAYRFLKRMEHDEQAIVRVRRNIKKLWDRRKGKRNWKNLSDMKMHPTKKLAELSQEQTGEP